MGGRHAKFQCRTAPSLCSSGESGDRVMIDSDSRLRCTLGVVGGCPLLPNVQGTLINWETKEISDPFPNLGTTSDVCNI
jgi:hypothetical protein